MDLLTGFPGGQEKIPIVSIIFMGGMGKSTIAQLVYNDDIQFDLKLWVFDSEEFDLKTLLRKILLRIRVDDTNLDSLGLEQLQSRLNKEIGGKKYFLVLDDIQNQNCKNWLDLEGLLNVGNKESIILATSRSREVAKVMGSEWTYELKGLANGDASKLYEKMAFGESFDENLVKIGKVIVKKCIQVPFSIKTIMCLLFGKSRHTWERVRDMDFAKIKEDCNDLIPILRIIYENLDSTLSECFQYYALFQKKSVIFKEILINLWIANSSVKVKETDSLQEYCEDYLKILYNRCFLEEACRNKQGEVTEFRMHALMHDLAREVARGEILVLDSSMIVDFNQQINL